MDAHPDMFANEAYDYAYLDLPHEDFSAYCRLCFSISQLEPLIMSGQARENNQIISVIETCVGIKLSPETDSPTSICRQCRYMLDEFISFRMQCQRLNRVFRRKQNERVGEVGTTDSVYQGNEIIVADAESYVEPEVAPAMMSNEATPIELLDGMCATLVTHEPSAFEASVAGGNETGPEHFTVHDITDEDDDGFEWIRVPDDVEMGEGKDDNDTFTALANDWFRCKLCSGMYLSFVQLAKHLREIHPEAAIALRNVVNDSYFHVKGSELQTYKHDGHNLVKCDLCDTLLCSRAAIRRHRWRYHGLFDENPVIRCRAAACGCFFMERKALNRHREVIHGHQRKRTVRKPMQQPQVAGATGDGTATNFDNEGGDYDDDDDDVVFISDDSAPQDSPAMTTDAIIDQ